MRILLALMALVCVTPAAAEGPADLGWPAIYSGQTMRPDATSRTAPLPVPRREAQRQNRGAA